MWKRDFLKQEFNERTLKKIAKVCHFLSKKRNLYNIYHVNLNSNDLKKFLKIMDCQKPMTKNQYNFIISQIAKFAFWSLQLL